MKDRDEEEDKDDREVLGRVKYSNPWVITIICIFAVVLILLIDYGIYCEEWPKFDYSGKRASQLVSYTVHEERYGGDILTMRIVTIALLCYFEISCLFLLLFVSNQCQCFCCQCCANLWLILLYFKCIITAVYSWRNTYLIEEDLNFVQEEWINFTHKHFDCEHVMVGPANPDDPDGCLYQMLNYLSACYNKTIAYNLVLIILGTLAFVAYIRCYFKIIKKYEEFNDDEDEDYEDYYSGSGETIDEEEEEESQESY